MECLKKAWPLNMEKPFNDAKQKMSPEGKGDSLYVVETDNGIELTANDSTVAEQVEAAERVMREDRDALKKLAE
jgi:hypothetical protein